MSKNLCRAEVGNRCDIFIDWPNLGHWYVISYDIEKDSAQLKFAGWVGAVFGLRDRLSGCFASREPIDISSEEDALHD